MAEKGKQVQYSLRSKVSDKVAQIESSRKTVMDKSQKNYVLNKEKALQKKAEGTKDESISHSIKTNNLVIKFNTAAYEMTKNQINQLVSDEIGKKSQKVSFKDQQRSDRKGSNVDTVIVVETEREEYNFTLNLYNTTNTIVVNGKGFYSFYELVLPKLYELIYEQKDEIAEYNKMILNGLKRASTSSNNAFPDEDIIIETKTGLAESKMIKDQQEDQQVDGEFQAVVEGDNLTSQEDNEDESKTIITQETEDLIEEAKEVTTVLDEEQNLEEKEEKSHKKEENSLNGAISCTNTVPTVTGADQKMEDLEVDFQTSNNQEQVRNEDENQTKGTKRSRGNSDEDIQEILPADKMERKERKVDGVDKDQDNSDICKQQICSEEILMTIDHSYASEEKGREIMEDLKSTKDTNKTSLIKDDNGEKNECPKCMENCETNCVFCETCNTWMHFSCIGTTNERVEAEYPGAFVCETCVLKVKDTNSRKDEVMKSSDSELNEKAKTQIVITQISSESDKIEQIKILERENKKLKVDMNNLKENIRGLKQDINHKDKLLRERKNESAKLHESIAKRRLELVTMQNKYDILKSERDTLTETMLLNKESWNEELNSKLQQQYILTQNMEVQANQTKEKMTNQYMSMMAEKEEIIKKKDKEIDNAKGEVKELKRWLESTDKDKQTLKEQEEKITNLEKICKILTKDKEQICLVNQKLEEQINVNHNAKPAVTARTGTNALHRINSEITRIISDDDRNNEKTKSKDSTVVSHIGKIISNYEVDNQTHQAETRMISEEVEERINKIIQCRPGSSKSLEEMECDDDKRVQEKRKYGHDDVESPKSRSFTKRLKETSTDFRKDPDERSTEHFREKNKHETIAKKVSFQNSLRDEIEQSHVYRDDSKKCFGCGSHTHEVKDCNRKCNLYARFKGKSWINRTAVEWAFKKYGEIAMIRVQRNRYGEETRSAMVCFKREEDAAIALERMGRNDDWEVEWYNPKERRHFPRQQRNDQRNEIYSTDFNQHFDQRSTHKNVHDHWSLTKPTFFDNNKYDGHFPKIAKGEHSVMGEVQLLKDQMQIMSKSIDTMLKYIQSSA